MLKEDISIDRNGFTGRALKAEYQPHIESEYVATLSTIPAD